MIFRNAGSHCSEPYSTVARRRGGAGVTGSTTDSTEDRKAAGKPDTAKAVAVDRAARAGFGDRPADHDRRAASAPRRSFGAAVMRRQKFITLLGGTVLAGAALAWPFAAQANDSLLDETVNFAGQVLNLETKVPALVIGAVRNGQTLIHGFGRRTDHIDEAPNADTVSGSAPSPRFLPDRFSPVLPPTTR